MHGPERQAAAHAEASAAAHEPRSAALTAEVAWTAIVCVTILAFMPLVPRASALSSEASPSRIMEIALLGLAFAAAVARIVPSRLIAVLSANAGMFLVLLAFTVWAAVTAIVAGKSPTGVVKAAELAAVLLVAFSFHADPRLRPGAAPRIIVLAVLSAVAILLAANVPIYGELLPMLPTEGQSRVRLMLGFNHPLGSALLLAVGIIAALFARLPWLATIGIAGLLVPLFLLCDARGISVGLLGAATVGIWFAARPVMRAALGVVVLVTAAAALLFLVSQEAYLSRLAELATGDAISLNGRVQLWDLTWRVAMDHPLLGVGYYNLRYYVITAFNWSGTAHNSFLEVLAGTGIPGAALFLAFGVFWLGRVASLRDRFLVALTPVMLIESNLNSILFAPSSAFLLLLLPMVTPAPQHFIRAAAASSQVRRGATAPAGIRSAPLGGR